VAIFVLVPILTGLGHVGRPVKEWQTFEVAVVQPRFEYLTKDDAAVLAGTKARRKLIEMVATRWSDLLAPKGQIGPF
jgi:hypothetical protein